MNPNVREALERLDRAVARLDSVVVSRGATEDVDALKADLARLEREHAAISSSAARVADRLDAIIGQVRASLDG